MPRPILPPSDRYFEERKDIFRRLANLERTAQLGSSSIKEGRLSILDDEGRVRARLGRLDDGNYGIAIFDEDGGRRFQIDGRGIIDPYLATQGRDANGDTMIVTSGTFTTTYRGAFSLVTHRGVRVLAGWATDPGTAGEIRLRNLSTGATTATRALAVGSNGTAIFSWLHGSPLGHLDPQFAIEVRRTAGTGNIWSYNPDAGFVLCDPDVCTASGV